MTKTTETRTVAVTKPAVSIQGIARRFGDVTALKSVWLDIQQGEFFSLLGPSGCGKTTLLRIIGGFEEPTDGHLLIDGFHVIGTPPFQRKTNMVFQHGALFPHLTVKQNIAFGLEMKRSPKSVIAKKVTEALSLVRLADFGDRRIEQLSGGQRQRIAIARALVNEPKVLLLDEPFSALDLQLRLHLQEELKDIQRASGATFVFVTHDQTEAIAMSDRMAVMHGGGILQVGTPAEVYERPSARFIAGFIGHSNILTGKITDVSGNIVTAKCKGTEISGWSPQTLNVGDEVACTVRYEKVVMRRGGSSGVASGVVSESRYLGGMVRHKVRIANEIDFVSEAVNAGPDSLVPVGTQVILDWPQQATTILRD